MNGVEITPGWTVPRIGSRGRRPPADLHERSVVIWNVGRLGPFYPLRRRRGDIDIAVLTAPLYDAAELAGILRATWRHPTQVAIHVAGAAIPLRVFARYLASRARARSARIVQVGAPHDN